MGTMLRDLKNFGAVVVLFVHDIMPIAAPEYFEVPSTILFGKAMLEALTFADFVLTTSKYNEATLARHMATAQLEPLPVHVVPLGHELPGRPIASKISKSVAGLLDTDYVLCVGTLEVRKNPAYLFNVWKMMAASGRADIPQLVFVGRRGWLVHDFLEQLKACNYLGGKILVLHNITDVELDWLYRRCMLTMFPSFLEGWGLPVGESLRYGKICLCSNAGGIPEVGRELADYMDPHNPRDGLRVLLRYLDDPEQRRAREREIVANFQPRSWRKAAEDFLRSTQELLSQARPSEGSAAIQLPQSRYLPITSGLPATLMDGMDATLSADLMCISGWHRPEIRGIRAAEPSAMIRFRADAPIGRKINLALKLAAYGRDFRIRICSSSGNETEVSVAAGSERMVAISCMVEPSRMVTARLLTIGVSMAGEPDDAYWMLKGILYFDPAHEASKKLSEAQTAATRPSPAVAFNQPEQSRSPELVLLRQADMDGSWRANSFGDFLEGSDCYWPMEFRADREAPIFADQADQQKFYSGCGNEAHVPQVGSVSEDIRLIRRSNQFVSTSRFAEGSVFDRLGVWKAFGYLNGPPEGPAPWLSKTEDGLLVQEGSLKTAPFYDGSYLAFYNGNLHNYYHWVVEGLLPLHILSSTLGLNSTIKIPMPKSVDLNAVFDHRDSLRAVGLSGYEMVDIPASFIRVREAIWIDSEDVASMPVFYLKDFQQRVATLHASKRNGRGKRRLLVARKGQTRKFRNLKQVQDCLSRHNFETVYLEGM
ncbi:MAG: glycosyltransferase, partial [Acidobacteriaceae bacterium]|nr:glycosyltransferase [Acidobacteriaceae bacterium]